MSFVLDFVSLRKIYFCSTTKLSQFLLVRKKKRKDIDLLFDSLENR